MNVTTFISDRGYKLNRGANETKWRNGGREKENKAREKEGVRRGTRVRKDSER